MRDYAEKIFASQNVLEQTLAKLSGAEAGHLNLAVPETANQFVTLVLAQFCKQHPGISFHLEIHNRVGLLDCIKEHTTDLVIMGQTPVELDLVSQSFMKNPLVIIPPPNHALSDEHDISLQELMQNEFVVREQSSGTRIAMQRFFAEQGIQLKTSMEMPNKKPLNKLLRRG